MTPPPCSVIKIRDPNTFLNLVIPVEPANLGVLFGLARAWISVIHIAAFFPDPVVGTTYCRGDADC